MINDTISDMLTRVRNANLIKKSTVVIPLTRLNRKICIILQKEGFIRTFQENTLTRKLRIVLKYKGLNKKPCITNLKRISKPGLRIYANHNEIPKLFGGIGVVILSTSRGVMTDKRARFLGIGGEILCSIW
uniref:Small ribosomal subunit protein uS8c n=1 Tax=Xylochloris irregularis TaxID=480381 RepID=A0A097KME5_9CHLO|nr:ribosomal protein S8 [Xylochloris irregularis]AIT94352.1 ribosomal protein S8 [Xylochloris irregularis]